MTAETRRITLPADEYDFIVNYDPERERSASRRDLIAVLEHIQTVIADGVEPKSDPADLPRVRRRGMAHAMHPDDIARWEERFRRDAPEGAPDECWPWRGRLDNNGYGVLSVREGKKIKTYAAHRMAWVYATGETIPEGLTIDHLADLCGTKSCLNPAHLEMVSHAENIRRKPLRKRERSWGNPANQRTCPDCNSVFHRGWMARHVCR